MKIEERKKRRWWVGFLVAAALVTAISSFASADNLLQLNFGNNTKIYFNDTQSQLNGTVMVNGSPICTIASGCGSGVDLNNYTTSTSYSGSILSTARNGMSTLTATIPNNAITLSCSNITGGSDPDYCTDSSSGLSLANGTGINITGNSTNATIGMANQVPCNPVTEYSVWNGSHWSCDNDGSGTGTVTSVGSGNGLTGGPITTTGTLSINATISGTGNYSYWNGSAWLTRADVDTDTNNYTTNITFTGTTTKTLNLERNGIVTNLTAAFTDIDTTYTNGTGLLLTATTFSVNIPFLNTLFYNISNLFNFYNSSNIGTTYDNQSLFQTVLGNTGSSVADTTTDTLNLSGQGITAIVCNDATDNCNITSTEVGDISSVVAGNGLSGGGTSGAVTLSFNDTFYGSINVTSNVNASKLSVTNAHVTNGTISSNSTCTLLYAPNGALALALCN